VRFRQGKQQREVRATREIVLSAGAIGSPHLLKLSGVGPADELRRNGIAVVHDAQGVGRNLQDHIMVPVPVEDRGRITGNVQPHNLLLWLAQHALKGTGPMASNAAESGAFVRTSPSENLPNIQMHYLPVASDHNQGVYSGREDFCKKP
jgi:choline dehydrogenase